MPIKTSLWFAVTAISFSSSAFATDVSKVAEAVAPPNPPPLTVDKIKVKGLLGISPAKQDSTMGDVYDLVKTIDGEEVVVGQIGCDAFGTGLGIKPRLVFFPPKLNDEKIRDEKHSKVYAFNNQPMEKLREKCSGVVDDLFHKNSNGLAGLTFNFENDHKGDKDGNIVSVVPATSNPAE